MNNRSYIGFINTHSKSSCANDDPCLIIYPCLLFLISWKQNNRSVRRIHELGDCLGQQLFAFRIVVVGFGCRRTHCY